MSLDTTRFHVNQNIPAKFVQKLFAKSDAI